LSGGDVEGSLRNRPDYASRRDIYKQISIYFEGIDLKNINQYRIDVSQFTSSTAYETATCPKKK
jgi:hypothetical protein